MRPTRAHRFALSLALSLCAAPAALAASLRPATSACAGCVRNAIEPWGDVLGDNPIARKAAGLAQIGDGGGDATPPCAGAPLPPPPVRLRV